VNGSDQPADAELLRQLDAKLDRILELLDPGRRHVGNPSPPRRPGPREQSGDLG